MGGRGSDRLTRAWLWIRGDGGSVRAAHTAWIDYSVLDVAFSNGVSRSEPRPRSKLRPRPSKLNEEMIQPQRLTARAKAIFEVVEARGTRPTSLPSEEAMAERIRQARRRI